MSAPKQAYKSKAIVINGISHNCTKLQVSESVHKSRFYLDGYLSTFDGIIGFVTLGSANANMHNLVTRGGSGRQRIGGQVVQLLNDGGLNTLAKLDAMEIKHSFANFFTIRVVGNSAYYIDTDKHGLEIKKSNESWNQATETDEGYLPKQYQITSRYFTIRRTFIIGDSINVRAYITNNEGVYNFTELSTTISQGNIQQQVSGYVPADQPPCSDPVDDPVVLMSDEDYQFLQTFTSTTNVNTGVYIYKGEPFENPLDANGDFILVDEGFYRALDGVYQHVFYISGSGEVMRRVVCIPTIPHLGYLSILPGFATPENPNANPELTYVVDDVVATTYTITGNAMEYVGETPQGTQKPFSLTVSANTSNVTWNTKPTLTKVANGKYRLVNVTINPIDVGQITQTNEI